MQKIIFFKNRDIKSKEIASGILNIKVVANINSMIIFWEFPKASTLPLHSHPHEQITLITEGSSKITAGGKTRILMPGEGVVIPSNVEHNNIALEPNTKGIDFFYPIREEYL